MEQIEHIYSILSIFLKFPTIPNIPGNFHFYTISKSSIYSRSSTKAKQSKTNRMPFLDNPLIYFIHNIPYVWFLLMFNLKFWLLLYISVFTEYNVQTDMKISLFYYSWLNFAQANFRRTEKNIY